LAETVWRYGAVEGALADILAVPAEQAGAFRARLRHLRNIGVPELPKPGTGSRISYTFEHALELLIALRLESIGTAPRIISRLAQAITGEHFFHESSERAREWGDLFVFIYPAYTNPKDYAWLDPATLRFWSTNPITPPFFSVFCGLDQMPKFEPTAPDVFSRLNVSACARKLSAALDGAD
jgi:hypothetical protein